MYVCLQSPFMFFCICYNDLGLLNCCFVYSIQTVFAGIKLQMCGLLAHILYVMTSVSECILWWVGVEALHPASA